MCGIIYMHDRKAVHKRLLQRYADQRSRGNEGFGFVSFTAGTLKTYKRFQTEGSMRKALAKINDTHVLFHHRYPTSTENIVETAHPIKVSHPELQYDYYVTHNGVISNPGTLKTKHEALGYTYTTALTIQYKAANGTVYNGGTQFNDTEALAIELARNIELGTPIMACGSAAFIVLKVRKGGKKVLALIYGTNGGNPLTIDRTRHGLVIASQGGHETVPAMIMYTIDLKTNITSSTVLDMAGYPVKSQYVGYAYPTMYDNEVPDAEAIDYDNDQLTELQNMLVAIDEDIKIAKLLDEKEELENLEIEKEGILTSLYAHTHDFNDF